MTDDARFEDGAAKPLRLIAAEPADIEVMSALIQDAVLPGSEITWRKADRRFALLINRFRWEDKLPRPERVQSVLVVDDALRVASQGVEKDGDTVFSILSLTYADDRLTFTLAGDGAVAVDIDGINVTLKDVTQSYPAISGKIPQHPED